MGKKLWLMVLLMLCISSVTGTSVALAADPIVMDGQFADWEGQAVMPDPARDALPSADILNFYWGTNSDEKKLYFMIARRGWGENPDPIPSLYRVYLDMSDNGHYNNGNDRFMDISYNPFINGIVTVALYKGNDHGRGNKLIKFYSGNWGESNSYGGQKCEFYANMADLGMSPGQPIRMYVESFSLLSGDRCPDSGDIQWSPIPILGWWGLPFLLAAGLIFGVYKIRKRNVA